MKKLLSILLTTSLLFLSFSIGSYSEGFVIPDDPTAEQHWGTVSAEAFAGGQGSAEQPYYIATAEQLARLSKVETKGKYFALVADIDLSAREWRSVPSFSGHLYGNGHTISGLNMNRVGSELSVDTDLVWNTGFIAVLEEDAVICDINFASSKLNITNFKSAAVRMGTVAGCAMGTIRNVTVTDGTIDGTQSLSETELHIGGIAGTLCGKGVIDNCAYNGGLRHTMLIGNTNLAVSYLGGAVGSLTSADAQIRNSHVFGYILSSQCETGVRVLYAGGFAGYLEGGSIRDCASEMNVLVHAPREVASGGVVGYAKSGSIDNCCANAAIQAGALNTESKTVGVYGGGLVGFSNALTVTDSYSAVSMVQATLQSGTVSAQAGKLVGAMNTIDCRNCYTSASTIVFSAIYSGGTIMSMPISSNNVGTNGFTYSNSFLYNILGWHLYEDLSDLSQNPNHIWVCGSTAPTPKKHSFLSVRYVDADGNVLGTYFTYCDIGTAYEVPSPALDGMTAAEPLPTGVLQQSTFMDVLCIPHIHTPGDAATCHSAQVCLTCQQVLAERLTHADDNGDYRCDHCGKLSIDVNGDGYLNIADVNDILCCLSGAVDISDFAYDIDENGILNINDLNELLIALSKIA